MLTPHFENLIGRLANVRAGLILASILIPSLLLGRWLPALPWLVPFIALFVSMATTLRMVPADDRRALAWLCLLVALSHVLILMTRGHYDPTGPTFWRDDTDYYPQAVALANAWKNQLFPDITRKGTELYYLGTLHTGYHRAAAGFFYLFGSKPIAGMALNTLSALILPVCTYLLVWDMKLIPTMQQKAPLVSAVLAALYPPQLYWTQFVLKDLYTAAWFVAALWLTVAVLQRRDLCAMIAWLAAVYILATLRVYGAASLVLGAVAYLGMNMRRSITWGILALVAVTLGLGGSYTDLGWKRFDQMWNSLVALAPKQSSSAMDMIRHVLAGIPRLMLGPYSWIAARGTRPLYGLYPGMWFLYILVYPAAISGLIYVLRKDTKIAVVPIMAGIVGATVLLVASYGGDAPRQRYYMEYICIAFASYGWMLPKRRVFLAYYFVLACYAAGQIITVKMRGL